MLLAKVLKKAQAAACETMSANTLKSALLAVKWMMV